MGEPAVWVVVSTGVTALAATEPDTTYAITVPILTPHIDLRIITVAPRALSVVRSFRDR
jgi:hypothetical protein